MDISTENIQILGNRIKTKRNKYILKYRVIIMVYAFMGDTLPSMATEISQINVNFKMWDKGKMIVVLSWNKLARKTMFSGDKHDTLTPLKELLKRKKSPTTLKRLSIWLPSIIIGRHHKENLWPRKHTCIIFVISPYHN